MTEPRMPNEDEVEQLERYLKTTGTDGFYDSQFDDEDEADDYVSTTIELSAVAVFDGCHGDETVACEKLLSVVWPGHPNRYEVFI